MQPTEPAAIASLPVRPRVLYEDRIVAFAFVLLASLGFAAIASLFAGYARADYIDGATPLAGATFATLAVLVLGFVLERIGAHSMWALVARALALAPVWAATLFFSFFVPQAPQLDGLPLGVVIVAVSSLAIVGAGRARELAQSTPRRSWVAIAGLAMLWMIPLPSVPVDVDDAPLVQLLVSRPHR
jgi:hypothetical protein